MKTYDLLKLHNLLSEYTADLNKRANDVLEVYENRENDRERLATCVILYNGYKEKWMQCCRLLNDIKEEIDDNDMKISKVIEMSMTESEENHD